MAPCNLRISVRQFGPALHLRVPRAKMSTSAKAHRADVNSVHEYAPRETSCWLVSNAHAYMRHERRPFCLHTNESLWVAVLASYAVPARIVYVRRFGAVASVRCARAADADFVCPGLGGLLHTCARNPGLAALLALWLTSLSKRDPSFLSCVTLTRPLRSRKPPTCQAHLVAGPPSLRS